MHLEFEAIVAEQFFEALQAHHWNTCSSVLKDQHWSSYEHVD